MKRKGFTILEVFIIVCILAILLSILMPLAAVCRCENKAKRGEVLSASCIKVLNAANALSYDEQLFCDENNISAEEYNKSEMLKNRFRIWVENGGKL